MKTGMPPPTVHAMTPIANAIASVALLALAALPAAHAADCEKRLTVRLSQSHFTLDPLEHVKDRSGIE